LAHYPAPSKRSEQFVGTVSNAGAYEAIQARIAHSDWTVKQVAALSKFGYRVADKVVASVLVELHNCGAFKAGLVVAGTLAYLSWLNEYGATALLPKTQEPLELARRQVLKLAAKPSFLATLQATQLPFAEVPGASRKKPCCPSHIAKHRGHCATERIRGCRGSKDCSRNTLKRATSFAS
jgi:hypothetical protein